MKRYFEIENGALVWHVGGDTFGHSDDIEFSSFGIDCIIGYGAREDGSLILTRYAAFPTLRTIPNNTHATYAVDFDSDMLPSFCINGEKPIEKAVSFTYDGVLSVKSSDEKTVITRCFFPAEKELCLIERVSITNISPESVCFCADPGRVYEYGRGTKGVYVAEIGNTAKSATIEAGETVTFDIFYTARIANCKTPRPDADLALSARKKRVNELFSEASLETGNEVLDTMYRFAHLRAGESIFATKCGLLHSPGGRSYYAATWCNDQIEYAGPWFACTGDATATEASINAYRAYIPFMSDTYHRIPSSIIAEGDDIWEGAGDRGDAAMYLYGASLFVLTENDPKVTCALWDAIKWCAEYCKRKTLHCGVVSSDNDELEGRFPHDRHANLSTSSLAVGGLVAASKIALSLGEKELADEYTARAASISKAIEDYFGAELHGYKTYRYSKGFDTLRAWICLPLCVGIEERLAGTLDAMFSPYLWTEDGMLTCEKGNENTSDTVWDRSTLYGFRGAFLCGRYGNVWDSFLSYCEKRLLSERVPYAVEAWPEGGKRHLSAESALFCRIITEGILGIRPEGMESFSFLATLPEGLEKIDLRKLYMNGKTVSIFIKDGVYTVSSDGKTVSGDACGQRVHVSF